MTDTFLTRTLTELARVPSAVSLGSDTLLAPDHETLVNYVQAHLRPRFAALGEVDILDLPLNQFAVRFGSGNGPCLALMAYTPTQHHNLMPAPWSGRMRTPCEWGIDEPCLFGQGVTQNKAHQAAMLRLAKWLVDESVALDGTLLMCVNNEGRSSHACSDAMLDALPVVPDLAIQLFSTGFDVHIGNRGRIDIYVHVRGEATHSSSPPPERVIDTVSEVVHRVRELDDKLRANRHPRLGTEQAVVYQMYCDPLAPHTLPHYGKVTVDRRLLPATDPGETVEELENALGDIRAWGCDVEVEGGVTMLPALFPAEAEPLLAPLDEAIQRHRGGQAAHTVFGGSFDAGGPAARGIPTVMFGVADEGTILGDDFVRLSQVRDEYMILRDTVTRFLGSQGSGAGSG